MVFLYTTPFDGAGVSREGNAHDADGNRVKTTYANNATEERSVNLANCVTALYNKMSGGTVSSSDTHAYAVNGAELTKTEHTGTVTAYEYDSLNRLTQEKETLGASITTKTYAYDAFGVPDGDASDHCGQGSQAVDVNPFLYVGQYFDRETETYYLYHRYYISKIGRFARIDSILSGLNWYTYCVNNSIALHDPLGLKGSKMQRKISPYIAVPYLPQMKPQSATTIHTGLIGVSK